MASRSLAMLYHQQLQHSLGSEALNYCDTEQLAAVNSNSGMYIVQQGLEPITTQRLLGTCSMLYWKKSVSTLLAHILFTVFMALVSSSQLWGMPN